MCRRPRWANIIAIRYRERRRWEETKLIRTYGLPLSLATPPGFLGPPLHSSPGHSEQGVHEVHVGPCGLLSKGSGSFLGSLGLLSQFLRSPPRLLRHPLQVGDHIVEEVLGQLGVHLLHRNATFGHGPLGL